MRTIHVSAFTIALAASWLIGADVRGQGKPAPAVVTPNAGDYATADIRVLTPGVVFMSGLPDIAAAFTKETGKTVGINTVGMGTIVDEMTKRTPPPDVIVLPFQLMNSLALEGGVMAGTMTPLGRNRMGLAVKAGAPKPDISTPEKFVAALKTAKAVMRSNPASRTMVATIIDDMFKRPEFAGVNAPPSSRGRAVRRSRAAKGTWRFRRSARFFRTRKSSWSVRCRKSTGCGSTRCWQCRQGLRIRMMRAR